MNAAGLFVYGTLKEGGSNFHRVQPVVTESRKGCWVMGDLYNLGPYPALVTPGAARIYGELLQSNALDEMLRITDALEGDEYKRVPVQVYDDAGGEYPAWTYCYAHDTAAFRRIDSGVWNATPQSPASPSSESPDEH